MGQAATLMDPLLLAAPLMASPPLALMRDSTLMVATPLVAPALLAQASAVFKPRHNIGLADAVGLIQSSPGLRTCIRFAQA